MKRGMPRRASLAALLLGASPQILANAIQYALVSRSDGQIMLEIRLTCSHRYDSHEPGGPARDVVVSLTRLGACADSGGANSDHDTARPAGREMAGLEEIDYDARTPTAAALQLHFRHPALVEIRRGGDPRSIRVVVMPGPDAAAPALPSPASQPPTVAAPALSAEQQARLEARVRGLTAPLQTPSEGGDYAINLSSTTAPPDTAGVPTRQAAGRQLYIVNTELQGQSWQQLRLGFYATEHDAQAALRDLRTRYPNAWVVRINTAERARAQTFHEAALGPGAAPAIRASSQAASTLSEAQLGAMMAEARSAFLADDFDRAVLLYTRVLGEPRHAYSEEAQEFLGVARDRDGQTAQAIAEYRQYLADYPEGEGAARVRQRLAALTTARDAPRSSLRAASRGVEPGSWDSFGSFSQYYRRDASDYGGAGMTTKVSLLQTDGDFSLRKHGDDLDLATRARLGYDYDLLQEPGVGGNRTRIYDLYGDLYSRDWGFGARLGRQTERSGGVLGRYDGAHLSYLIRPDVKLNLMGGFPVYLSSDSTDTSRVFYGLSMDLDRLFPGFDTSFFYNTQEIDSINDRQAVGAEVRYFDDARSVIGVVDYDIGFGTFNTLTIIGNWSFDSGTVLSASADYRRTPFPLAENALIGQSADSIDELLESLTEDQIRDLASDRSGEMLTYSFGISRPLARRWQVNADFSVIQIAEGPGSGGVLALPDSGTGYYAYASLVGSSLFTEGDVSIFGIRYGDNELTRDATVYLDSRFPLTNRLRLNPLLAISRRQIASDDSSEWLARPALRFLYRFARNYELDFEGGAELGSRSGGVADTDTTAYYIYAGYRADF
jgi:hypothetical protein